MKNLAGNVQCDIDIQVELAQAKIPIKLVLPTTYEVPFNFVGKLGNWVFERLWYYWAARASDGKGIPVEDAATFNRFWHSEARVDGFSGGMEVGEAWRHKTFGTVDSYHIDTQSGLDAFAELATSFRDEGAVDAVDVDNVAGYSYISREYHLDGARMCMSKHPYRAIQHLQLICGHGEEM